jgi:hypothetical protein
MLSCVGCAAEMSEWTAESAPRSQFATRAHHPVTHTVLQRPCGTGSESSDECVLVEESESRAEDGAERPARSSLDALHGARSPASAAGRGPPAIYGSGSASDTRAAPPDARPTHRLSASLVTETDRTHPDSTVSARPRRPHTSRVPCRFSIFTPCRSRRRTPRSAVRRHWAGLVLVCVRGDGVSHFSLDVPKVVQENSLLALTLLL